MIVKGEIDELAIYLGADYQITDKLIVHHPTIAEIAEFGEKKYYSAVFSLTAIPSDMKFQLEDMGFNYLEVSDYDLFLFLAKTLTPEYTSLLLGPDVDLSKMTLLKDNTNDEIVLVDVEKGIKIDRSVWMRMVSFISKIHGINRKPDKKPATETVRQILIKMDRDKAAKAAKEPVHSELKKVLSSLMRTPSCTQSLEELKAMPLFPVMDMLMGIQIYTSTNALMIGSYSGMVDTSKINKKEFDWMRDVHEALSNNKGIVSMNEQHKTSNKPTNGAKSSGKGK